MTLIKKNNFFSINNIFKSKYLIRPLISLVVLQMVLMPVATVLAQEVQNLNNFVLESGTVDGGVTAIDIVDPLIPSADNVTLLNSSSTSFVLDSALQASNDESHPLDSLLLMNTTTEAYEVKVEVTPTSSAESLVILNTDSARVAPDLFVDSMLFNSISALSASSTAIFVSTTVELEDISGNSFIVEAEFVTTSIKIDHTDTAAGIPLIVENDAENHFDQLLFLLDEMVVLKKKAAVDLERPFLDEILSMPISSVEDKMVDDSLFRVIDEYKDEVDLGNGKKALKIYSSPRQIFIDKGVKKIRPQGWSKFSDDPVSKIRESKKTGYDFGMPFSSNKKVDISAGIMESRLYGKQISAVVPAKPSFSRQTNKEQNSVFSFNDIFEGINVNFIDKQNSRTKEIIITKQPSDINMDTEIGRAHV